MVKVTDLVAKRKKTMTKNEWSCVPLHPGEGAS